jgi:hypothetical protein
VKCTGTRCQAGVEHFADDPSFDALVGVGEDELDAMQNIGGSFLLAIKIEGRGPGACQAARCPLASSAGLSSMMLRLQ